MSERKFVESTVRSFSFGGDITHRELRKLVFDCEKLEASGDWRNLRIEYRIAEEDWYVQFDLRGERLESPTQAAIGERTETIRAEQAEMREKAEHNRLKAKYEEGQS